MTMTKAKQAVKFPMTRLAVGGLTVAGFLGLWSAIAISSASDTDDASLAVEQVQPMVVDRQVVYLVGEGALPPSTGTLSAVVSRQPQAASAPPKAVKSSSKKSKGS